MKPVFPKRLKVELLQSKRNGYECWNTFTIRDLITNVHIATVGEMDAYYSKDRTHERIAMIMAAGPEMLELIEYILSNDSVTMPVDLVIKLHELRKKLTFV